MILDVGCGRKCRGDVCVDVNPNVEPDVVADINSLPFPSESFSVVMAYHVIEHEGVNPVKAVHELLRVGKDLVEVQVPHWLSRNAKADPTHKNFEVMHVSYWLRFRPKPTEVIIGYAKRFKLIPFPDTITVRWFKRGFKG